MNLSKIALVLFGGVALLTVGAPIASASPAYSQMYWTTQPASQNQPVSSTGQQGSSYAPRYGNWYGPMNSSYWQDYDSNYYPVNNGWNGGNMWQSGGWGRGCW